MPDVANAVLDGVDGILLGQETLRGGFPVETVQTIVSICTQVGADYRQSQIPKTESLHWPEAIIPQPAQVTHDNQRGVSRPAKSRSRPDRKQRVVNTQ